MRNVLSNQIKVNRAIKMSEIGAHAESAAAMLLAIPESVVEALPARLIAQLLDANWTLAQQSKAIAERDAISEGAIWDGRRMREIAA
ncbi:hypothetical protein D2T31_12200 [Sinirhodobacter populi]|uniref:Uncharacterized protein n=1 Tax=Paenirhodobacter populi TaxID=2306993 RepID=A0A443K7V3_9RHOB|nr:hypothetical protein [Sinirhodobacter populi]RWR28867.1 hypothetical protein D2T31_12200 [Sinirhodobacter populi]